MDTNYYSSIAAQMLPFLPCLASSFEKARQNISGKPQGEKVFVPAAAVLPTGLTGYSSG